METARIPIPGGETTCAFAGTARAPALLLLHGWTLDHRMWRPQLEALSGDYFVLCPDRRGFGRSTAPADAALEAGDAMALLDHFNIARAVIVGMSQAGRVALDIALRFPGRARGLVLVGARAMPAAAPAEIPIAAYAALVASGRIDEMKAQWSAHPLMHPASATAAALTRQMLADYDGRDLLAAQNALADLDADQLKAIALPTLALTGSQDTPARRAAARSLADAIPGAKCLEIADAAHLCNVDQPDAFNRVLTDFVMGLDA